MRERGVSEIASIEEGIKKLFTEHKWEKDWIVVTHINKVDDFIIIIGGSRESRLDFKLQPNTFNFDPFQIGLNLNIINEVKVTCTLRGQEGNTYTPLLKNAKLKDARLGFIDGNLILEEVSPSEVFAMTGNT